MSRSVLKIHPADNALVALQDLAKGQSVRYNGSIYELAEDIPAKHKFFVNDMNAGEQVIMYAKNYFNWSILSETLPNKASLKVAY